MTVYLSEPRIVVVGDKIQIAVHFVKIDGVQRRADVIGGDKVTRTGFSEHHQLFFQERGVSEGLITVVIWSLHCRAFRIWRGASLENPHGRICSSNGPTAAT